MEESSQIKFIYEEDSLNKLTNNSNNNNKNTGNFFHLKIESLLKNERINFAFLNSHKKESK